MKVILKWGCIPRIGLAIVAWGLFGAPRPEPTAIFSELALFGLLGAAVFIFGVILTAILSTRERNRIRDRRHRGFWRFRRTAAGGAADAGAAGRGDRWARRALGGLLL